MSAIATAEITRTSRADHYEESTLRVDAAHVASASPLAAKQDSPCVKEFVVGQTVAEPLTTAELVIAAQTGDREAFGELAERFEGMVQSVALRRLGNHAEAMELSQEVLLRAMDRLHQLSEPAAFGGWLRSITVRMAINRQVRRRRAIDTEPQTLEATCISESTPLDSALSAERAEQVRDGLSRLGEMDRSTLVAFYVTGQSLIEMSDAFSAPVGTIKRRLHVARKRLAAELEEFISI